MQMMNLAQNPSIQKDTITEMSRVQSPESKFGSKAMPKPVDHNTIQYVPPPNIHSTNFMPIEVNVISIAPGSAPTISTAWLGADKAAIAPVINVLDGRTTSDIYIPERFVPRDDREAASKFNVRVSSETGKEDADLCENPKGMDRLTCGEKDATLGFGLAVLVLLVVIFGLAGFWIERQKKRKGQRARSWTGEGYGTARPAGDNTGERLQDLERPNGVQNV